MKRNKNQFVINLVKLSVFFLFLMISTHPIRASQPSENWTQAINLSNSDTQSSAPSMTVDPYGNVHVVWSEETETGSSFISYSHFEEGEWTPANEIITSRWSQYATDPSISADSSGNLHMVWLGDQNIYYSTAYAPIATSATNWLAPIGLEYPQNYIGKPDLIVGEQDHLFLVYPILLGENSGIYFMDSTDQGVNWNDPVTIYKNNSNDKMVNYPKLAVGQNGILHVVWVEFNYPETFPAIGIRYANSSNGGANWSNSLSLADGPYSFPAIITLGNGVHVVWSGTGVDRFKFHRRSIDDGGSWLPTWRNTELGGYQGFPDLVVDSNDIIHWLTTGTVFQISNDSVYHTQWVDEQWLPGEVMLKNEINKQNPTDVSAEIRLGNELFVAVQYPLASNTQQNGWQYEIYLLHKDLGTPPIKAEPIPRETAQPTALQTPIQTSNVPLTPTLFIEPNYQNSNPLYPILVGLVASVVIVLLFILFKRRYQ